MIAVVILAVLLIGFFMLMGLALPLAIGSLARDEKSRKAAVANAPAILDGAFDGSPDVVFKVSARTLPFEDVVIGAKARGYKMLSETTEPAGKTLVFTKKR